MFHWARLYLLVRELMTVSHFRNFFHQIHYIYDVKSTMARRGNEQANILSLSKTSFFISKKDLGCVFSICHYSVHFFTLLFWMMCATV